MHVVPNPMNYARILALTFCGEEVIVSLVYGLQKDWRMCIYWFAAAVIGVAVVW